ncbi:MAG TPA: antibiotic biosynthesis monooxygenase family protein [Longimicrobium sp.]|jgi:quinol monooxygenase YgiN
MATEPALTPASEIRTDAGVMTLINVFTVAPERQQELLDVLVEATECVMRHQPGFVSANLHRSHDGTRIVNYAQWRSREDFEAMLRDPRARPHMSQAASLAQFDPIVCEVAFVDHA